MSRPSVVSQKIFRRIFVAIHKIKPMLVLNKLIYVGFSILDLSKLLMYEFHYKYIGVKYGSCAKLLFIGTDSLIHEIEADNVNEDFYKDKSLFDCSNYHRDLQFYDPVNKKVIGKMKDEVRGKIIHEFAELKSNMYSLITVDDGQIKKAKSVNKKCC